MKLDAERLAKLFGEGQARAIVCRNACAGIADPEAFIEAAKEIATRSTLGKEIYPSQLRKLRTAWKGE